MRGKITAPAGEPEITRFIINRTTRRVNYTIEGYGQVVKGVADPGTTPLRAMIQFLADYAPLSLEAVPDCLTKLQARGEFALEWDTEDGVLFETGVLLHLSASTDGLANRSNREAARNLQRDKLEQLKRGVGYGKYALPERKSS